VELGDYATWMPTLVLVAARLLGMLMVAPAFGHAAVPVKLRIAAVLAMSPAVAGQVSVVAAPSASAAAMAASVVTELLIGLVIGYAARLILVGVRLGAFHVDLQTGLSIGEAFDPLSDEAGGSVRALFALLAVAVFVLIGGHRSLILATLRTYQTLPPGAAFGGEAMLRIAVSMLAAAFTLGLKLAAPVVIAMLLATTAMGFLQKTLPQANLLSTHLPVRVLLGLAAVAASLGVLRPLMEAAVDQLTNRVLVLTEAGF